MVDVLLGLTCKIPKEQPCIGNTLEYSYIKTYVRTLQPGCILLVYGPPGCGKTFLIENALNACKKNAIKLNPMRIKINTIDTATISIIKDNILMIDDIDKLHDLDNCIINKLLDNKRVPIVCSCRYIPKRLNKKKENIVKIQLKYIHKNEITKWLTKNEYPQELIYHYRGDLNAFVSKINLWKTSRWMGHKHEFYINIEDRMKHINTTPLNDAFTQHIDEPGAMCGIIQQNYPKFKHMDIATCMRITEKLSFADVYTSYLYNGLFSASQVYQDLFYASTVVQLRDKIPPIKIEPGQAWTKHINMIARTNKLQKFKNKNGLILTPDHIATFNVFLRVFKQMTKEQVEHYIIEKEDVDIFTKLFTVSKITPRVKTLFKEMLSKNGR